MDNWDHEQAFSVQFSGHHLNTRPFDNQTQIYHSNTRLVWYSDGHCRYRNGPDHLNTGPFETWTFNWFLTKWLQFVRISDPIQNLDHLQTNLFLNIQNFRSPLYNTLLRAQRCQVEASTIFHVRKREQQFCIGFGCSRKLDLA